jgi:hypothetical protein
MGNIDWLPIEGCPQDGLFLVYGDGAIRTMLREDGDWKHVGIPVAVTQQGDRIAPPEVEHLYGVNLSISDCIYEPTHYAELNAPT